VVQRSAGSGHAAQVMRARRDPHEAQPMMEIGLPPHARRAGCHHALKLRSSVRYSKKSTNTCEEDN